MMTGVRTPSNDGAGPGFAAHASAWSRTRLTPIVPLDTRLQALARAIGASSNLRGGGAQIAQFGIHPDPELSEYFSHNRIEADFFRHFFSHPDVQAASPIPPPEGDELGFRRMPAPAMFETLVDAILSGGAYRPFKGTEHDARKLATQFGAAVGERFLTAAAWLSLDAWNPLFAVMLQCRSYFWFDRITNVRGKREKPGLMRQHITAIEAACRIGGATCEGVAIGASEIVFTPGRVVPGDYHFAVGTAGSTGLVFQTVLMPLPVADGPSRLNMLAPPFDFMAKAFAPLVRRLGGQTGCA
jgi:hypothetical protein